MMRLALRLAARGEGRTSPNPMVGAVVVRDGKILGRGWHRQAGLPHAEIEALRNAERHGHSVRGATLYVTLEPCCTYGRTPPCTDAILAAGIGRVVVAARDPNPVHAGRGFRLLRRGGTEVVPGVMAKEAGLQNEAFNHWIVHRTPFVTVKAAMTLDGKIATRSGESKWITGLPARSYGMRLRQRADAILVGVNTVLADDPSLTLRSLKDGRTRRQDTRQPRRIILDSSARTPTTARICTDQFATLTTIVVSGSASAKRVAALRQRICVELAPTVEGRIDLRWLMQKLGAENVTSLLVEGGGEVNASFLFQHHAHRVAFFYAPKILGGRDSRKAVGGAGVTTVEDALRLSDVTYRWLGTDLLLEARVAPAGGIAHQGKRRSPAGRRATRSGKSVSRK